MSREMIIQLVVLGTFLVLMLGRSTLFRRLSPRNPAQDRFLVRYAIGVGVVSAVWLAFIVVVGTDDFDRTMLATSVWFGALLLLQEWGLRRLRALAG